MRLADLQQGELLSRREIGLEGTAPSPLRWSSGESSSSSRKIASFGLFSKSESVKVFLSFHEESTSTEPERGTSHKAPRELFVNAVLLASC